MDEQQYVVINARTGVQVGGLAPQTNAESAKFQACWHTAWNMEPGPYVVLEKVTDGEWAIIS